MKNNFISLMCFIVSTSMAQTQLLKVEQPDPIFFDLDSVFVRSGDTASVALYVDELEGIDIIGLEFQIDTGNDSIQLVDLNLSSSTEEWTTEYNHIDQISYVAMAGFDPIASEGLLCELQFSLDEALPTSLYTLEILDIIINTGDVDYFGEDGILNVLNNGLPTNFNLITPSNGSAVSISSVNIDFDLQFTWDLSTDPEGENVYYYITNNSEVLAHVFPQSVSDTYYSLSLQTVYDSLFHYGITNEIIEWNIGAMDQYDTTWASNGPFSYTFDITEMSVEGISIPDKFELLNNFPNPFNPTTKIQYRLPVNSDIQIKIYNINGQLIYSRTVENQMAGEHTFVWSGENDLGIKLSSGIYFYEMNTPKYLDVKKMILIK